MVDGRRPSFPPRTAFAFLSWALVFNACSPPPSATIRVEASGDCTGALLKNGDVCGFACAGKPGDSFTSSSADGCTFEGWDGPHCSGTTSCTPSSSGTLVARYRRDAWPFRFSSSGSRSGALRVVYDQQDTTCTPPCNALVPAGASVTVTAIPAADARFAGFLRDCATSSASTCDLIASGPKDVEAIFDPLLTYRVSVSIGGSGSGRVTSNPLGIDCEKDAGTCSASFARNSTVSLSAAPLPKNRFIGWQTLLCSALDCPVPVNSDLQVRADFARTQSLALTADGGTGAMVEINGASHALPFQGEFDVGSQLRLHAKPSPDDTSLGWTGLDCQEARPMQRCTVVLTEDRSGQLQLARLANWIAGGWTGAMQFKDALVLPTGNLAVLASFFNNSNFTSPPLINPMKLENLLFELTPDGGVARWSRSYGGGHTRLLSRTSAGLFAVGTLPTTGTHTVNWGGVDGGALASASEFIAVHVDEAAWQPDSYVLHADAGLEGFKVGDFQSTSPTSVVASFAPQQSNSGIRVATLSHDFKQVKSLFNFSGTPGVLPSEGDLYLVSTRFADGGTGFGDCGGVTPAKDQFLLARVSEQGQCLAMVELPEKANGLDATISLSTQTSSITYGVGGLTDAGMRFVGFGKHDSSLATSWRSPVVVTPKASTTYLIHKLIPWRNGTLFGYFGIGSAGPLDLQFSDGLVVRCPTAAPSDYSGVLVVLSEATGAIEWAHCLPGESPTGVGLLFEGAERQGDSIVLMFSARTAPGLSYTLGRLSLPVVAASPVFLSVTPPR